MFSWKSVRGEVKGFLLALVICAIIGGTFFGVKGYVNNRPMFDVGDKFMYGRSIHYISDVYADSTGVMVYAITSYTMSVDTATNMVTLSPELYSQNTKAVDNVMATVAKKDYKVNDNLFRLFFNNRR